MEKDIMTTLEFKTVMEMVVLIIESSENKEEALAVAQRVPASKEAFAIDKRRSMEEVFKLLSLSF